MFFSNLNLAADILRSPDRILQDDKTTEVSVINILNIRTDSDSNNDSSEISTSIKNSIYKTNKIEPIYVNSNVDNTYIKVSIIKVHLSEDGIRLSVKVFWNILKDDRQTEDWIGCYTLGLYLF